ncbi:rhomboid family intramembrane serine protease [Spiroplasma platyhelix]|uniref:Rhomboid family intramembrane serine protease n=1 Tax=Spiroplasma platyhelix PALS-1 TaxID=1276218 RepID=A0A846TZX1_9MOLU|nr:rhomboid family intramembrane serine protease [Spiroplasma platyhelix]MBE4703783.1 hypothetical protein [Spiroplasma platyhelix PALS-1]NKE38156.1 rhomboid family intramembrane serine protease [Spiroplasma platyhelix PALS-1]UJB29041.1 hypothetical protein SPLAT_v1c02770 [Spiroplasma platyhelix PALS-1]
MEENILDVLGLQLVDYFINFQEYQPFNVPEKLRDEERGKVYLVNKNSRKYQVIKIIKQSSYDANEIKTKDDQVVEILKKDLAVNEADFKMLILILNSDHQNEFRQSPTVDIIVATPNNIVRELAKTFPSITKAIKTDNLEEFQDEEKQDEEEGSEELTDRQKNWKKINFQNRRFLKDALLKSTNPHLVVTWLFFALPIVSYVIFTILINSNPNIFQGGIELNLIKLVFGASHRNLIFGANQYWRWLTYPLVQFDSLALVFSLWMFYRVGRYIEGFYGLWKSLIIWVSAVILTGVIQSTVDHVQIMNGFEILSLISIGAMIPIIWNYRLFKSPVMNKIIITFILMLLFWIFFSGMQVITLLYWMIAIGSGWLVGAVVSYHNRKLTLFYAFSPVAIGLLILFAILVAFLNPYYHFDEQGLTRDTLNIYQQFNIVSEGFVSWVMSHYFGQ